MIFDNIYKRLEQELHNKRKDMAGIIEVANSAYEQRDKAQERLALLMKQVERERALASGHVPTNNDDNEDILKEVTDDDFKSSLGDEAS